jgi:hypothetical protein
MIQTVEAVIEPGGAIRLLQPVEVSAPRRALLAILHEEPSQPDKPVLAEDWRRFGKAHLARAFGPDEPEYTVADLKPETGE